MHPPCRLAFCSILMLAVLGAACGGSSADVDFDAVDPPPSSDASETCLAGAPDCADSGGEDRALPDEPADPEEEEFPVLPEPIINTPGAAVAFSNPYPWDQLRDDSDGSDTTMLVTFTSPPAPCNIVDRVEVTETESSVEITLFTGPAEGSEEAACPAIVEYRAVPITLSGPLADRELIDASLLVPEGTPQ